MAGVTTSAFEATTLRYVHDVLTGEFVTVGVVLVCPHELYVGCKVTPVLKRVRHVFPEADIGYLRRVCGGIEDACEEWREEYSESPPLTGAPTLREILPRLVPPEDAALQFSPIVLSGITRDPEASLGELFQRYTGEAAVSTQRRGRGESEVWKEFTRRVPDRSVLKRLQPKEIASSRYSHVFEHAWKNGTWNAVQPVSFDLLETRSIREKALSWSGRLDELRPAEQGLSVKLLVALPKTTIRKIQDAAADGLAILKDKVRDQAELVSEAEGDELAAKIVNDLRQHAV